MMTSFDTLPLQPADLHLMSTIRALPENNRLSFILSLDNKTLRSDIQNPTKFKELISLISKPERLNFIQHHMSDLITNGVVLSGLHCHLDQGDYVKLIQQEHTKIKNGYELTMILATLHKSDYESFIRLVIPNIPNIIVEYDEFVMVMNKISSSLTTSKSIHIWREVEPTFNTIKALLTQSLGEAWFSKNITTQNQFDETKPYLTPALIKHWMRTASAANMFVKPQPGM